MIYAALRFDSARRDAAFADVYASGTQRIAYAA